MRKTRSEWKVFAEEYADADVDFLHEEIEFLRGEQDLAELEMDAA